MRTLKNDFENDGKQFRVGGTVNLSGTQCQEFEVYNIRDNGYYFDSKIFVPSCFLTRNGVVDYFNQF